MDEVLLQSLIDDYKEGGSLRSLSLKHNIPVTTVYYNLSKLNIVRRQYPIKSLINHDEFLIGIFIGLWCGDGCRFVESEKRFRRRIIKIHLDKRNRSLITFISGLYLSLFGKRPGLCNDGKNKVSLRLCSKFVYSFLDKYVVYDSNKTLSIRLKDKISDYSLKFLRGFLIGLTLSDGSIKGRFCYTSISSNLIDNLEKVLILFNYNFSVYNYKRPNKNWHELYQLYLTKKDSFSIIDFMDSELAKNNLDIKLKNLKLT